MTTTACRVDVLGVPVTPCTLSGAVERVATWISSDERSYATFTGVHGVMESRRAPEILAAHRSAGLIACDGAPLVWASRWAGVAASRVTGRDFMVACCERAARDGWSSFFYGGKPGLAQRVADELQGRFPGLDVAGTLTPPFRPLTAAEDREVVETINASGARLVWVGLSTPKQELWMSRQRASLRANALFGVGAAFDYVAGELSAAPRWMQSAGLEWLHRAMLEPGRLGRRYARNNPAFVSAILRNPPKSISSGEHEAWAHAR